MIKIIAYVVISFIYSLGLTQIVALANPFRTVGVGGIGYWFLTPIFFIVTLVSFILLGKKLSKITWYIVSAIALLFLVLVSRWFLPF